jgi:trk system potassium uptake protein TrkA
MKKIAIIGLSSFGISALITLSKQNIEIIAIDIDDKKVDEIKDLVTLPLVMDATKKENLKSIDIDKSDVVIVSTGPSLESSILIVKLLKDLGVKKIIAKALSEDHEKILEMIGADEISYPERDAGVKIAKRVTFSNIMDYLTFESGFVIQEIASPDIFYGKSLIELDVRNKYNITIIAIRSIIPDMIIPNPSADFIIKESDILIIFGSEGDIEKFHKKIK